MNGNGRAYLKDVEWMNIYQSKPERKEILIDFLQEEERKVV